MSRSCRLAPAAIAALAMLPIACAQSQDLATWCEIEARRSCGDEARMVSLADCMDEYDMWPSLPHECVGEIQTLLELEREAFADTGWRRGGAGMSGGGGGQWTGNEPGRRISQNTSNMLGYSYGGILRQGPGMEYRKMASLYEGQQIEILEDTGVWFNGFKWFRVATSHGTGFHWGGIFCTEGGAWVEGVLDSCN